VSEPPDPIVREELRLLEEAMRALAEEAPEDASAEESIVRELERVRALLVSGQEQKDQLALLEQWDRGSALLRQLRASRAAPRVDRASPYFAHLRLRESGRERDICLGKGTCIRRGVRIVDWRNAPISRLFYRYQQGETYEEELAGRVVAGEVAARRTVSIRAGVLERVDAPEGSWLCDAGGAWNHVEARAARLAGGEGAALRAHSPALVGQRSAQPAGGARRLGTDAEGRPLRADKRLPDVAGLLDPEQFELISRPRPGCLVVRGSAGSGKTTVALHRIAYLAYEDPQVDSPRTLFLTLSPALRDYVGHVLPGLGVGRVRVQTFPEWAARQRRRLFPALPAAERADTPDFVRRLKLHPHFERALAAQVRRVPGPADPAQALDDWASALTDPRALEAALGPGGPLSPAELRAATDWCRARNEELFAALGGDADAPAELDAEDDALLLRAWQLRVGPLQTGAGRRLLYRHVAVDEVQDFSPVEVQVLLGCLGEDHSLTLAGDTQQHLASAGGFTSWSEFLAQLGVPGAEVETLRISYRSSRPIVSFALEVLGALREDEAPPLAPRSGPAVELFRFTDRGACVAHLADALHELAEREPLASVALLAPSAELSALYHEALARCDVPRLRRVRQQDFTFAPGVEVTEIEQVKGLEFDYVVLVDVSDEHFPDTPAARRLLHVAATRAVHQLWLTCVGTPSSLVRSALAG
jgi:DNA helicase-2/ATP-dependent DNA helicase PcrA